MLKKIIAATTMFLIVFSMLPSYAQTSKMIIQSNFTAKIQPDTAPGKFDLYKVGGNYTWNKSYALNGKGGKKANDYAFFIQTTDYDGSNVGTDFGSDPFLGYFYTVSGTDVTVEASLFGPCDSMRTYMMIGINGYNMYEIGGLYDDGSIRMNYKKVGEWKTGRWYKLAATYHAGTCTADFYLNGEMVLENSKVTDETIKSFTRIKLIALTVGASKQNIKNNLAGFDNIRWYTGEYEADGEAACGVENRTMYIYNETSAEGIKESLIRKGNSDAEVFKDETLTEKNSGILENGNVVAVYSPDEEIIEYIDIVKLSMDSEFETDNENAVINAENIKTVKQFKDGLGSNYHYEVCDMYGVRRNDDETINSNMLLSVFAENGKYLKQYRIKSNNGKIEEPIKSSIYNINEKCISGVKANTLVSEFYANILKENQNVYFKIYDGNGKTVSKSAYIKNNMLLKTENGETYEISVGDMSIAEDFEDFEIGKVPNGKWYSAEKDNGSIEIEKNGENKFLSIKTVYKKGDGDAYIQSKSFNAENITVETDICAGIQNDRSWSNVLLRDNANSANDGSLILFSLHGNKISYLPGMEKTNDSVSTEDITNEKFSNIKAVIKGKRIVLYKDGIIKATAENYKTYYKKFDAGSCALRIQCFSKTAQNDTGNVICDNIRIYNETGFSKDISAQNTVMYINGEETDNLCDGRVKIAAALKNSGEKGIAVRLVSAMYDNGKLEFVKMSEPYNLENGSMKNISTEFLLDGISAQKTMKVMVWDSTSIMPLQKYNSYIKYEYSADELEKLFNKNVHPRIIAAKEDFSRMKAEVKDGGRIRDMADIVMKNAEAAVNGFTKENTSSPYYIGYLKDNTGHILEISRRVKQNALLLSTAYILTEDDKYSKTLWEIINTAAGFEDWDSQHFLDTAEMTMGFAIAYDWLYDVWTQEQRSVMEKAILNLGIKAAKSGIANNEWWLKTDNNWNFVCNGGIIAGASAIADIYPEESFKIAAQCLNNMKNALQSFAPDGAWFEGVGYWHYAVEYFAKALSTCTASFNTDFGMADLECIKRTAAFAAGTQGAEGVNNFHDSGSGHINSPEMFYLAKKTGSGFLAAKRLDLLKSNPRCATPLDLIWYDADYQNSYSELPKNLYFRDVELIDMYGDNGTWLSAHAGKSVENHSHLDCGSFVFESMGERFAEDLGGDSYALDGYFDMSENSKRWQYYRMRAEAHNTIVINPSYKPDQDVNAETYVTEFNTEGKKTYAVMDLSSAYPGNRVTRRFVLESGENLEIHDEIELKTESDVYWFMNTKADVTCTDDGAILNKNGKKLKLEYNVSGGTEEISAQESKPLALIDGADTPNPTGQADNSEYKKVMIKIHGNGKIGIDVKLSPGTSYWK